MEKRSPLKQVKLDYLLVTDAITNLLRTCDIKPGYSSKHSNITMYIILSNLTQWKGTRKLNNSFLPKIQEV